MGKSLTRRRFIEVTAGVAAIETLGNCTTSSFDEARDEARKTPPIVEEICQQHLDLIRLRSQQQHESIRNSLRAQGARPLCVGAAQIANYCGGEAGKKANLERMLAILRSAKEKGVQVLAFPEMCLPGYFTRADGTPDDARKMNHALADVPGKSTYLKDLQDAARDARMVIAFGFGEKSGRDVFNSIGGIDADGTWLGTRRKNPLSPQPYETESFTEPDARQRSTVWRSRHGTIGIANCFDGEFPESIRRMRLNGAELLLWCNAATGNAKTGHSGRINASGCYAQTNRMWVVCCNAVGGSCYGTSVIIGPSGEPLVVLPPSTEALGVATINLAMTSDWESWRLRLEPGLSRQ